MKPIFLVICLLLITVKAHAQQLNWGSDILGVVTDSTGVEVDNSFVFELGSFFNGFTPDSNNVEQWLSNWEVFDSAQYDTDFGYFAGDVYVQAGVTSSNPTASQLSFSGLDAYIWIRKGDVPIEGAEWLLTRALNWSFPVDGPGCCDLSIVEWSTATDLTSSDTPLWGRQYEVLGPGVYTANTSGSAELQTFTFIPEPSAFLMSAVAAMGLLLRRRRPSVG
jgi:hypothetical protein